jgi:hypothetical protein
VESVGEFSENGKGFLQGRLDGLKEQFALPICGRAEGQSRPPVLYYAGISVKEQ